MARRPDPYPGLPVDPDESGQPSRATGARPPSGPSVPSSPAVPSSPVAPSSPAGPGEPRGGRPLHLQPGALLLVLAGGALGAAARYAIALARPTPPDSWPWDTFVTNLVGAFALGALLETLARAGPDTGRRRAVRLGAGTGFLGAFTTYSTLAVEADLLLRDHHPGPGIAYLLLSAAAGVAAAWTGIVVAAAVDTGRRTAGRRPRTVRTAPAARSPRPPGRPR